MNKTVKWILIGALVIALLIGLYFLAKASEPKLIIPGQAPQPAPGDLNTNIVGILGSLFTGIQNLFGGGTPKVVDCDPDRPGYEKDGTANPNCAKDYTGCKVGVCDPKRSGYDECGFPTINC